jgi:hypothetical protein
VKAASTRPRLPQEQAPSRRNNATPEAPAQPALSGAAFDLSSALLVGRATGAEAAWAYLDRRGDAVRLLLTDVALAGLDGYALGERAAELNPRLETVVMARLRGPQLDELIDQIPFVSRPVQPGELAHVLEAVVGLPQEPAPMPRIPRPIVARRRRPGRRRVP